MKTAQEIADHVGGVLHGDGSVEIHSVGSLEHAGDGDLAYAEGRHLVNVAETSAACILIPAGNDLPERTVIVVDHPRVAFARAAQWLLPPPLPPRGMHETAVVSPDATIGSDVAIGPWTVIEAGAEIRRGTTILAGGYVGAGARIGADGFLHPHVVIYPGVTIGDRVIAHAGVVVGADGFGFVFDGAQQVKVPQLGDVQIGDDVELGANACIDRGSLDDTRVADGVKIDNLCQVAHNVRIGQHAIISSQTGIAGSSTIGREAIIGGQVGIADYCRIDDHAIVGAQCGVPSRKRIPAGQPFWGTPARPLKDIKTQQGYVGRLPKIADEVKRLRAELEALKAQLN